MCVNFAYIAWTLAGVWLLLLLYVGIFIVAFKRGRKAKGA